MGKFDNFEPGGETAQTLPYCSVKSHRFPLILFFLENPRHADFPERKD